MHVTLAWLDLSAENFADVYIASLMVAHYFIQHQAVPLIGTGKIQDAENIVRWHSVPFRWSTELFITVRNYVDSQLRLQTTIQYDRTYHDTSADTGSGLPGTPILSSTASSPLLSVDGGGSLPPSPSQSNSSIEAYEREFSVEIPPSPTASYYEGPAPVIIQDTNDTGAASERQSYSNNMATLEPSVSHNASAGPALRESKAFRSKNERCFLPSDQWEARVVGGKENGRTSRSSYYVNTPLNPSRNRYHNSNGWKAGGRSNALPPYHRPLTQSLMEHALVDRIGSRR